MNTLPSPTRQLTELAEHKIRQRLYLTGQAVPYPLTVDAAALLALIWAAAESHGLTMTELEHAGITPQAVIDAMTLRATVSAEVSEG